MTEIKRTISEIDEAIISLEDAIKSTTDFDSKQEYWNRKRALLWLIGEYECVF